MEKQNRQNISEYVSGLSKGLRNLGVLYFRKARLKTTEKLTILLSTIAFAAVSAAIALVLVVFVTIGVGHLLATSIAPHMAYLIVAGFYLVILVIVVALRRKMFIDPIARFMSRLLVEPPAHSDEGRPDEPSRHRADPADTPRADVEIDYDKLAERVICILEKNAETTEKEIDDIENRIQEEQTQSYNEEHEQGGEL